MRNEIDIYFKWSFMALFGLNPTEADIFLRENLETIKSVSKKLLNKINYQPSPIYRGVILREPVNELTPHENFTYLSFSESKNIAISFADPTPSGFGSVYYLGDFGYVIEYTPTIDEVLFHHKFIEILPYTKTLLSIGYNDETIREQKEVTILQPSLPFKNIKEFTLFS